MGGAIESNAAAERSCRAAGTVQPQAGFRAHAKGKRVAATKKR